MNRAFSKETEGEETDKIGMFDEDAFCFLRGLIKDIPNVGICITNAGSCFFHGDWNTKPFGPTSHPELEYHVASNLIGIPNVVRWACRLAF